MALHDRPSVDAVNDSYDRRWQVGPVVALIALSTFGALDVLFLVFNLGVVAWLWAGGAPTDPCPRGVVCSGEFDVLTAALRFLFPLLTVGLGWFLAIGSLVGPKTVDRRRRRLTTSIVATACPVVVFFWILI